jgi:hypothetical protein
VSHDGSLFVLTDNRGITFELISSHGRISELLHFAQTIGDWEWVLGHHIQHRNYRQALRILRESDAPSKIAELYYKFAPTLIAHLPRETVDMLILVMGKLEVLLLYAYSL